MSRPTRVTASTNITNNAKTNNITPSGVCIASGAGIVLKIELNGSVLRCRFFSSDASSGTLTHNPNDTITIGGPRADRAQLLCASLVWDATMRRKLPYVAISTTTELQERVEIGYVDIETRKFVLKARFKLSSGFVFRFSQDCSRVWGISAKRDQLSVMLPSLVADDATHPTFAWRLFTMKSTGRILNCGPFMGVPDKIGALIDATGPSTSTELAIHTALEQPQPQNSVDTPLDYLLREAGKAGLHKASMNTDPQAQAAMLQSLLEPCSRKFVFHQLDPSNGTFIPHSWAQIPSSLVGKYLGHISLQLHPEYEVDTVMVSKNAVYGIFRGQVRKQIDLPDIPTKLHYLSPTEPDGIVLVETSSDIAYAISIPDFIVRQQFAGVSGVVVESLLKNGFEQACLLMKDDSIKLVTSFPSTPSSASVNSVDDSMDVVESDISSNQLVDLLFSLQNQLLSTSDQIDLQQVQLAEKEALLISASDLLSSMSQKEVLGSNRPWNPKGLSQLQLGVHSKLKLPEAQPRPNSSNNNVLFVSSMFRIVNVKMAAVSTSEFRIQFAIENTSSEELVITSLNASTPSLIQSVFSQSNVISVAPSSQAFVDLSMTHLDAVFTELTLHGQPLILNCHLKYRAASAEVPQTSWCYLGSIPIHESDMKPNLHLDSIHPLAAATIIVSTVNGKFDFDRAKCLLKQDRHRFSHVEKEDVNIFSTRSSLHVAVAAIDVVGTFVRVTFSAVCDSVLASILSSFLQSLPSGVGVDIDLSSCATLRPLIATALMVAEEVQFTLADLRAWESNKFDASEAREVQRRLISRQKKTDEAIGAL